MGFLLKGKKMRVLSLIVILGGWISSLATAIPLIAPTGADSGWDLIVNGYSQNHVAAVVDSVNDNAVIIELIKDFAYSPDGSVQPLYVKFQKRLPNALPNIVIADEFIENNTGFDWHDFHMILISMGDPDASFDPQVKPVGAPFDTVYYSGLPGFDGLPTVLNFEDGTVANGQIFQPGVSYTQPGGHISIITNPQMQVGDYFYLKEIPSTVIPEPATIFLMGAAAIVRTVKRKTVKRKK